MNTIKLKKATQLKGEFIPPPDKSISHRAVFFSSIAKGKSMIKNFLHAADPLSTLNAFRMLGVEINEAQDSIEIKGKGLYGLKEPDNVIDCGNSGTTIRLLTGLLSAFPFLSVLTGDSSLRKRPMSRVIVPLRKMNAHILARDSDRYPPIAVRGGKLKSISYELPVASAQLKSSLLLAGLYAEGTTEIEELLKSRDHTERMLSAFGADIVVEGLRIRMNGGKELHGQETVVPGDFSSTSFFLVASLLAKNSELIVRNVGINPTRTGFLQVIQGMNGAINVTNRREVSGEPMADIICRHTNALKSIHIDKDTIPALIDEVPILCVLATQAEGISEIRGAEELRVKESDRISAMVSELRKMGASLEEYKDGVLIEGPAKLQGAAVNSHNDHRIAMALSIAALISEGETTIMDADCVDISFKDFYPSLMRLIK